MKPNLPVVLLLALVAAVATIVWREPQWIGDENPFLRTFVGEQFLGALGVILAINLASLAQLHLSLNRIEESRGRKFLQGARGEIRSSARWMIGTFVLAVAVVVVKPLLSASAYVTATANGMAILILGFYILIMADIVDAVFDLEPEIDGQANEPPRGD